MGSDHERIAPLLASHERKWTMAAAEHEEAAEKARTEKHRVLSMQVGIPDEHRRRLEATHDATIRRHASQAKVNRRRAEHAANGYLLHSPSESGDADYMREHSDLIGCAQRTGRMRQTDERLDD